MLLHVQFARTKLTILKLTVFPSSQRMKTLIILIDFAIFLNVLREKGILILKAITMEKVGSSSWEDSGSFLFSDLILISIQTTIAQTLLIILDSI